MNASVISPSDVWLCAYSARTPVGLCAASAAAAVRAGLSALELNEELVDVYGDPAQVAVDPLLMPDAPIARRRTILCEDTLAQLFPEQAVPVPGQHILIVLAGRSADQPVDAHQAKQMLSRPFPRSTINLVVSDDGHTAGIVGLGIAARALEQGKADAVIVLGADSYCDRHTIQVLDEAGDLKSEENRNGFHPGEGAAALLIAPGRLVRAMGLNGIAKLTAVSCAIERVDPDGEEVLNGEGLSAAFSGLEPVIRETGVKITDTYCDLNGVRYRNDELIFAVLRTQSLFEDAHNYLHPADCWGDVGAASGPLFAVLAAEANRKGYATGSRALLWASSHSGSRAAALLDFPVRTTS